MCREEWTSQRIQVPVRRDLDVAGRGVWSYDVVTSPEEYARG
jgi:hypothetical protein